MGQKAVPEPAVLIGGLGRRGGGEDDPTSAAKLSQARFGGQKAARLRIDVQNLRPNAAGKTTVEEQDQALCRYPREPFLQQLERDRGAGEIIWIRVVGDELMCLRPMAGERDPQPARSANASSIRCRVASASASKTVLPPSVSKNSASSAVASRRAQVSSSMPVEL
ncbi:MAG TPA: hypothetical protein PKE13_17185 [Hyphomicrobium zavarzinii]|nr:hypothetical protein [Hyphomicrobium zavarzinii]